MITFSDSRQGTARFAIQAQLESERNFVRSFIYHKLWSEAEWGNPKELEELRQRVASLEKVAHDPILKKLYDDSRRALEAEQAKLDAPVGSLPWEKLVGELQGEQTIRCFLPNAGGLKTKLADFTQADQAKLFLYREFVRRPRRQNSLETLGLAAVTFPQLENATEPLGWPGTRNDWADFLKLCIDFFIRSNSCVDVEQKYLRWLGTRITTRYLLGPDDVSQARNQICWPAFRGNRIPRMARWLALAFQLSMDRKDDRALIEEWLRKAWDRLVNSEVIS